MSRRALNENVVEFDDAVGLVRSEMTAYELSRATNAIQDAQTI
jgi:hypothetical protein